MSVSSLSDLKSYTEALSREDADKWKEAIDDEFLSLLKNNTLEEVDLPSGKKTLNTKCVFRILIDR